MIICPGADICTYVGGCVYYEVMYARDYAKHVKLIGDVLLTLIVPSLGPRIVLEEMPGTYSVQFIAFLGTYLPMTAPPPPFHFYAKP